MQQQMEKLDHHWSKDGCVRWPGHEVHCTASKSRSGSVCPVCVFNVLTIVIVFLSGEQQHFTFAGVLEMLCSFTMAIGSVRASLRLFSGFLYALMRAPGRFFDSTPHGRILNRVADDISCIDRMMPFTVRSMANCMLAGFASLFVIAFATPWCLLSVLPLAIVYYYIQVKCWRACHHSLWDIGLIAWSVLHV